MAMLQQPGPPPAPARRFPLLAAAVLVVAVFAGAIYANLSFAVTNRANLRYFPPFKPFVDANMNRHLGAEYFCIAKALVAGEGFADPFQERTGPTAWMPPLLSAFEAALLWAFDGDRDSVVAAVVFCQVYALVATGLLTLVLAWRCGRRAGAWFALFVFVGALCCEFKMCFQITHDCWLVMLALGAVVAGFCCARPLRDRRWAAAWGVVGGASALVSPMVALVWGTLTLTEAVRQRVWKPFAFAALAAGVTLAPWTARNLLVFGRLIPVKSNLAFELYQSQCLQPDGLIQRSTFAQHPYGSPGRERQEYKLLGEMAYLDKKREQFWSAVRADPLEFLDRVACRFLGVTVWYVPFERDEPRRRPYAFWLARLTHPLPFLSLLALMASAPWLPLRREQWVVAAAYLLYVLPYIAVSYYDRYGVPLLGVKVLLVVWAVDRLLTLVWPGRLEEDRVTRWQGDRVTEDHLSPRGPQAVPVAR
jgi:hypothetical protein